MEERPHGRELFEGLIEDDEGQAPPGAKRIGWVALRADDFSSGHPPQDLADRSKLLLAEAELQISPLDATTVRRTRLDGLAWILGLAILAGGFGLGWRALERRRERQSLVRMKQLDDDRRIAEEERLLQIRAAATERAKPTEAP